jgi:hypothetical protein
VADESQSRARLAEAYLSSTREGAEHLFRKTLWLAAYCAEYGGTALEPVGLPIAGSFRTHRQLAEVFVQALEWLNES